MNAKYHFAIDLAASKDNAKCDRYFSVADDSLSKDWSESFGGAMYLNPPYGRHIGDWVKKAYETSLRVNVPIVMFILTHDEQYHRFSKLDYAANFESEGKEND